MGKKRIGHGPAGNTWIGTSYRGRSGRGEGWEIISNLGWG